MADGGVRELFEGYEIQSITKLFAPREEKRDEEGNHHYCFVEASALLSWKTQLLMPFGRLILRLIASR
jgi:hypothetical protein